MAITTDFLNFIVPIKKIHEKYPGGWEQCLKDHEELLNGRVWYDDHLFRDGAMNGMDMEDILKHWEAMGFECLAQKDDKQYWKEACVFASGFGSTTLPCDWLEVDRKTQSVYLKGTAMGEIVYPPFNDEEFR
ncbi:hypothetical protein [Polynucleobacter antarcticus]|uniref:Uncharacterized protein n=1 Tax=Polynucleobacter antarcticus TaxID=1743162 RepID=A0A6M9PQS2_9BURK|nr:hypothetical protein [Polynucleobacter antarcticus]QKM62691.1 hypothetical protein DCO16_06255 [Polynucleobacter antarcticus]